jgi:hypothetical protein
MNQIFESHKSEAKMERAAELRARKAVNHKLADVSRTYHVGLPIGVIADWLAEEGFELRDGIYCGEDGRIHEQVGPHTWLSLTWHKMESGRYEIVAYLS